jgi:DNA-binding PadR family transcriptional regulator
MSPVFRHGRLRLYLLKLLDEAPRHGYEVIRLLQDRFMGIYAPSPGTIYPRLARLEEEGLVTHDEADGRKVYRITEKGREELRARLDDLAELEEEITASVRDIAREVTEDVRDTVRTLREELSWAARDFHTRAPRAGGADPGGGIRHASTDEARARAAAARTREAAAKERVAQAMADAAEAMAGAKQAADEAQWAAEPERPGPGDTRHATEAERPGPGDTPRATEPQRPDPGDTRHATEPERSGPSDTPRATEPQRPDPGDTPRATEPERPGPGDTPHEERQPGPPSGGEHDRDRQGRDRHDRDRQGRDRHEDPGDWSGRRRGEREWGEWAGWTGWGGWPGAAGQHGWADPDTYRDLERLAKQFSRELRSAAWHAQAVSEDALRDLRGILDETIDRIKDEVFKGKTPPGDPEDEAPPAD